MRRHKRQFCILSLLIIIVTFLSFTVVVTPAEKAAIWYDKQTDALIAALTTFKKAASNNTNKDSLLSHFFRCRKVYKRTELFIDVFMPTKARNLNGPDLLKIDEDSPLDSIKAHGFQVIERILFGNKPDRKALINEIRFMIATLQQMRNDPDRKYYFTDDKIWLAMRLATFRNVSMGITGFDVPLSFNAIPETREVLATIHYLAGNYKQTMADGAWHRGKGYFIKANQYLSTNSDFNSFNRLYFIRHHINNISKWLAFAGNPYVNTTELYPLDPYALHLFDRNIINIKFFSPNPNYYVTPERIALGKRLFFDPILSGNGSRSCASCHKPELAFTDGLTKAMSINNKPLLRNTPTLWNAALQTSQFYDTRARVLEHQMSLVVHDADEMNGSILKSIPQIMADTAYSRSFREAYPNEPISHYNIGNAVSSYIRSLISFNSRFDRYMRLETDSFTTSEKNGFNLFMGKARCGTCHYAPLFNGLTPPLYQDTESETLAVPGTDEPTSTLDADEGRYRFTRLAFHKYAFKTPTVRNAALTAPYMHNGVFTTLEAVIDFYNDGGGAGRGIELATQTLPTDKLGLTQNEKKDIIAFLHTLTDTTAIH